MGRAPCDTNGLKKGPWTQEEDAKLKQYIQANGPGNWRNLPQNADLQRCGKSCRLRWTNYLRPDIKRGRFSFEEEETIIQLHSVMGNRWSAIAARLPGRTDNEIKNYWNTHIRKRLLRMGVDPVTHSPRIDFRDLSNILGSAQLNLSNLLGLQTMVNPELLSLANLLSSSQYQNPDLSFSLQKLQQLENIIKNGDQVQNLYSNQYQNPTQVVPPSIVNQAQLMEGDIGQYLNPKNSGFENFQGNQTSLVDLQNMGYSSCMADQNSTGSPDSQFIGNNQSRQFDSGFSTPISSSSTSTPLNSSSAFVNSISSKEDGGDRFCSNVHTFEIPESFNFEEFIM